MDLLACNIPRKMKKTKAVVDAICDIPSDTKNCLQDALSVKENDEIVFKEFILDKSIGKKKATYVAHTSKQLLNPRFIDFHATPLKEMVYLFDI